MVCFVGSGMLQGKATVMNEEEQQPVTPLPAKVAKKKKVAKKRRKATAKKSAKATTDAAEAAKTRAIRNFPASTFQDALVLADAFQKYAAGQTRVRKLTIFDKIGKSPDSGPSRQLITNSSRYGLTKGGTRLSSWN
jgi:hypothetical protein